MDPEEIADLTRNGEVLITHPDAGVAAVMPESVRTWTSRGWELYKAEPPPALPKRTPKKTTETGADTAPKDKE